MVRWQHGRRRLALVAALTLGAITFGTCRQAPGPAASRPGGTPAALVVASFNFPESEVLAELYAQALEHAGITVRRELDLGPRELVAPALEQGFVDVVPEYLGSALASFDPGATVTMSDPAAVHAALVTALGRDRLRVLGSAPAQNQNGFVVLKATADRLHLSTVSDLAAVAPDLTLGGPPECPVRPYCLAGLQSTYGLRFARFAPFPTEDQRVAALDQGVIDVAVMFTTDAHLAAPDVSLLIDDRALQPADNVTPVVSEAAVDRWGARLTTALDGVSARLTSTDLTFLNWRVVLGHKSAADEARGWLQRHGLLGSRS